MAKIDKTAFEERVGNSPRDALANITGIFRNDDSKTEICSAGFLCVRDTKAPNEGYAGLNNANTWYMKAAAAATNAGIPVFVCDTHNVNQLTDGDNAFKVGSNTLGLAAPAGEPVTFKHIVFDGMHQYRFGAGNLSAAVGDKKFLTIADGLLTPAAAAPTDNGGIYFEVLGTGTFTEGAYASFDFVEVMACTVVSSVASAG